MTELVPIHPLEQNEVKAIEATLANGGFIAAKDRVAYLDALEWTALTLSRRIEEEIALIAYSLYLIREYGLFQDRENELGLSIQTWEEYLAYTERQGLARSTTFKHLASLRIYHKGLGEPLESCFSIPGNVRTLHYLKDLAVYNQTTGEILGPKNPTLLNTLPHPEVKDYAVRLKMIVREVPDTLSPSSIRKLMVNDWGGQPQINFYTARLGPLMALCWYYSPDQIQEFRGIVGMDEMPQIVADRLRELVRASEQEPQPYSGDSPMYRILKTVLDWIADKEEGKVWEDGELEGRLMEAYHAARRDHITLPNGGC